MFIGSLSMFSINTRKLFVSVQDLVRERSCLIHVAIWFVVVVHLLSCVWLCDPMDCSMPGFPVLHYLLEFSQTHVHGVDDAIQPSYPLLLPSTTALNLSRHQGLFQWVGSSPQVAQILELQHQYFQWIFRVDFLYNWLVWSPYCSRDSQESSPESQSKSISSSVPSLLYGPILTSIHDYWKNDSFDYMDFCQQSDIFAF